MAFDEAAKQEAVIERHRASLKSHEQLPTAPQSTPEVPVSDDEINDKYLRGEIRIVTEQARYPLDSIPGMVASPNYRLDPEFQRRHRWNNGQKSRLIESFIMNVPVPPIFLFEYDFNRYEVMDGLQRMSAIADFYGDDFALVGLEHWTELTGRTYSQLPQRIRDGIDRRYLSSIVLLKETGPNEAEAHRLKRLVFGRINTGGVQLGDQELRNALIDGPMNQLCKQLSENRSLLRLWGILPSDPAEDEDVEVETQSLDDTVATESSEADWIEVARRHPAYADMTNVELVLRFFANRQRLVQFSGNLDSFLDRYLEHANRYPPALLGELRALFEETVRLVEDVLGPRAFWVYRHYGWRKAPSVSVYDAVMSVFSNRLHQASLLRARSVDIQAGMPEFYNEFRPIFNLRGQSRRELLLRDFEFDKYIDSFVS
ncbi:MAG: DUF262 domain-containing protein [Acidimicrobiia bacterium]